MTRFSFAMLPDYPVGDCIEMIRTADELGFYAAYSADETWHKDMWLIFAAAADKTSRIRMGPNVTHVILKEPTILAQQLATLDELTDGRTEAVVSFGNLGMLQQYNINWADEKPLSRLREGMHVMRTFLDEGAITFDGDFFSYSGLFTFARPVQEHLPLKIGGMGGPKSFHLAGEISEGLHHALGYSRENYDYVAEHYRKGVEAAGKRFEDQDFGAWICWACAEDGDAARKAARIMVAFYISSMPESQLNRHGYSRSDMEPILEALGAGNVEKAIELCSDEIAQTLSVAGTPEECAEQINRDMIPTGVNHIIAAITDSGLVKTFSGVDIEGVPDVRTQLHMIAERVMPALD